MMSAFTRSSARRAIERCYGPVTSGSRPSSEPKLAEAFGRVTEGLERRQQVADEPDQLLESRRGGRREAHPFRVLDRLVQTLARAGPRVVHFRDAPCLHPRSNLLQALLE